MVKLIDDRIKEVVYDCGQFPRSGYVSPGNFYQLSYYFMPTTNLCVYSNGDAVGIDTIIINNVAFHPNKLIPNDTFLIFQDLSKCTNQ